MEQLGTNSIKSQQRTPQWKVNLLTHHLQTLAQMDWKSDFQLTVKETQTRERLFKWIFATCKHAMDLKDQTCEQALRMFDTFLFKWFEKQEEIKSKANLQSKKATSAKRKNPLSDKKQAQHLLITCMFTASKYNEIYPPTIDDFSTISPNPSVNELIRLELQILTMLSFNLNIPTVSQWYSALYNKKLPNWGYLITCYLHPGISCYDIAKLAGEQQHSEGELNGGEIIVAIIQKMKKSETEKKQNLHDTSNREAAEDQKENTSK